MVAYGAQEALSPLLASAGRQTLQPSRIRVWDNGPGQGVGPAVAGAAGVEVHRSAANLGFGEGVNRLFALAESEVVVVANPDLALDPACVQRLAAALEDDPEAVVAGGALADTGQPARVNAFGQRLTWDLVGINTDRGLPFDAFLAAAPRGEAGYLGPSGALFAVHRRRFLARVGGPLFPASFFLYMEDVALWVRLRRAGVRILFCPAASATHGFSLSTGARSALKLYQVERNRLWLLRALSGRPLAAALLPFTALRYLSYLLGRRAPARAEAAPASALAGAFARALRDGLFGPLPADVAGWFGPPPGLAGLGGLARYRARLRDQLRDPVG